MGSMTNTVEFTITEVGERTGETFAGTFTTKVFLSFDEEMTQDRLRRQFLGENAIDATPRAADQAMVFSELAVRLVDAPAWWEDSRNGRGLFDDNVVKAVYDAAMKPEADRLAEAEKKAKEAKDALRKEAKEVAAAD